MMKTQLLPVLLLGCAAAAANAQATRPAANADAQAGVVAVQPDRMARELMQAADSLRDAIHAMAERPAGPGRNQAIRDANRALLDLQAAMANAYDLTALQHKRTTLAVQDLRCERLADATVCH